MKILPKKNLKKLLIKFNANVFTYNKSKILVLDELYNELKKKDCTLEIKNKKLYRMVNIVVYKITHPDKKGFFYFETKKVLPDNTILYPKKFPAEKVKENETIIHALERGLKEEIELSPKDYTSRISKKVVIKEKNSPRFPNIKTIYKINTAFIALNKLIKNKTVYDKTDNETLSFRWTKA